LKGLNYRETNNKNIKNSYEWFELQTKERTTKTLGKIVVAKDSNFILRKEKQQEHHRNNSYVRFEL